VPTLRRLLPLLVILALAAPPVAAQAEVGARLLVVANREVPVDGISSGLLQRIYLGKATRWDGGLQIRPVMLHDPDVHEAFVTGLLDRSEESFSVYWKRMVFTGKGRPPRSFDAGEELAAYLRETPGAIGFLDAGADTAGLKVLSID
jgi:ABC-type phosphate transport system substrate-binding protein